ncbi:alpha/beta fold hydrolase [Arsenicicoccus sp. MKL-02]|uniref:Alpha/beta fold hydrolase n=1 Tax=Arsenicicoccus cauae TaxID=2663847 RepID=A0A6I3J102_9MICO|nr:alpha/beta hydrolase [Arsenicicoccus cauae]MTB73026.1 alpha/beta fold hydrolase [Arsenicicoccus cauae]
MNINGHELAVEISGSGPAVLMVHGLGGTSNFYQVQADALQDNHTVIRVDSAGAGRSELAADISIESHADDLAAVLGELDCGPADVVWLGRFRSTPVVGEFEHRRGSIGSACWRESTPPDASTYAWPCMP